MEIRKAQRKKAKLRLGLMGSSGSGKTYSALQLAFGLGGRVGLIDTEHGSGELYATMGDYDVIQLEAPYTVPKYREAIKTFEDAGYDIIIIDSLTHAWAGEGGLLDKQGKLEKSGSYKNSFAAWREITPEHNKLVEELLNSPCHVIGTMRSKTEYVLEINDKGKQVPRKIGLAPVQREGMEYEFTVMLDINDQHVATATKDRTMLFADWHDHITKETGKKLMAWLESGVDAPIKENPLMVWLKAFEAALPNKSSKKEIEELVANHSKNLVFLHDKEPEKYEKLMDEIRKHEEGFDLAENIDEAFNAAKAKNIRVLQNDMRDAAAE